MKVFYVATLLALGCVSPLNAADKGKHLFILSGQSNMANLDPSVSFTPILEKEFGKERVTVVKDAQKGQPLSRWYKKWKPVQGDAPATTGDLYDRLMKKVNEAINDDEYTTVTLIWMQGERDAKDKQGEVYADSLRGLIAQFSDDLKRNDINLVVGRLSDSGLVGRSKSQWAMVRQAQVEVAEASPRGAWVDTDDLNDGKNAQGKLIQNDLHYSVEGYKMLGERFAQKSIDLIKKNAETRDVCTAQPERFKRNPVPWWNLLIALLHTASLGVAFSGDELR